LPLTKPPGKSVRPYSRRSAPLAVELAFFIELLEVGGSLPRVPNEVHEASIGNVELQSHTSGPVIDYGHPPALYTAPELYTEVLSVLKPCSGNTLTSGANSANCIGNDCETVGTGGVDTPQNKWLRSPRLWGSGAVLGAVAIAVFNRTCLQRKRFS
jgi:hypothetical protein